MHIPIQTKPFSVSFPELFTDEQREFGHSLYIGCAWIWQISQVLGDKEIPNLI